ncbi:hypothetical protein [Acetobacterium bakii]|uniref:Uncharacterized protein n=1 Tax=Acetobacterium bakii TaxID=52689 RepID=A0A0L6U0S8_9FIRM|nr:hypothetical protein [Acetobacterium bakii]KNZ41400.1 hypothetical protein AKG39_12340 [Acetobacterium bakii]
MMKKWLLISAGIGFLGAILFISDASIIDIVRGNVDLNLIKIKDMGFAVCIGVFSSAVLAILIELINENVYQKKKQATLKPSMWLFIQKLKNQIAHLTCNGAIGGITYYAAEQNFLNEFINTKVKETHEQSEKILNSFCWYLTEDEIKSIDMIHTTASILSCLNRDLSKELYSEIQNRYNNLVVNPKDNPANYSEEAIRILNLNIQTLKDYKNALEKSLKVFDYLDGNKY